LQEDQQITTMLKSLKKEMSTMAPKEHKWVRFVNYHSSEPNPDPKRPYPYGNNWFKSWISFINKCKHMCGEGINLMDKWM
jgi:hypothetical protein